MLGILPIQINEQLHSIVKFFRWQDCSNDFNPLFNRLHAKLFHFDYANGTEYLLIGSMNASIQAFGSQSTKAVNEEAGIILKRKSDRNYL